MFINLAVNREAPCDRDAGCASVHRRAQVGEGRWVGQKS